MNNSNDNRILLKDYLQEQLDRSYYSLYGERLLLAKEYLFSCVESGAAELPTACDKLYIAPVGKDNGSFCTYRFIKADDVTTNGEYTVAEVACLLFTICFCFHPFKGMAYYSKTLMSAEDEKEFLNSHPRHIFDTDDNPNRFINGYHEAAWLIWRESPESQHKLWNDALYGAIPTLEILAGKWMETYSFECISSLTTCGHKVDTLAFNDDYMIVTADQMLANKEIYCYKTIDALREKCNACNFSELRKWTTIPDINVKVALRHDNGETQERKLRLYDKKRVTWSDLGAGKDGSEVFSVITAKKENILGIKNLQNTTVNVSHDDKEYKFKSGGKIPLLEGAVIDLGNREGVQIIIEVPVKKRPLPKPAVKAQQPASSPAEKMAKDETQKTASPSSLPAADGQNPAAQQSAEPIAAGQKFTPLEELIKNNLQFPSEEKKIGALINFVSEVKSAHDGGKDHIELNAQTVGFDMANGRANIAASGGENGKFAAPEVKAGLTPADNLSDRFTMAALMFYLLCRRHPFDGKLRFAGKDSGKKKSDVFIFDPTDDSNRPAPEEAYAEKEWNKLPPCIQELFIKAFSGDSPDSDAKKRTARPDETEWLNALNKWLEDIKSN